MKAPDFEPLNYDSSLLTKVKIHKKPLNKTDHLIARVGIGIVDTVERYYQRYLAKPNEVNAKAYCLWRLRLHRRLKNDRELLDAINNSRGLGLYDDQPGKLCWECDF